MSTTADITEVREQALERLKKKQDFRAHVLVYAMSMRSRGRSGR